MIARATRARNIVWVEASSRRHRCIGHHHHPRKHRRALGKYINARESVLIPHNVVAAVAECVCVVCTSPPERNIASWCATLYITRLSIVTTADFVISKLSLARCSRGGGGGGEGVKSEYQKRGSRRPG